MRQKATTICTPKYDKRGLDVMNQEAKTVTSMKRTVNPDIESRYGRINTCEPIPNKIPPAIAPVKRKICFWRDAPIVERAVNMQVVTAVLIPGQSIEL